MQDNSAQCVNLGSVGGRAASATAGAFSAGTQIAGTGGVRGDTGGRLVGSIKAGGDVRVSTFAGSSAPSAAPAGAYAQGDQFAAVGGTTASGSAPKGGLTRGGDARTKGAGAASASGVYNQGMTLTAKTK